MSGIRSLETLLERKNQCFICEGVGSPDPGGGEFVARIYHDVRSPERSSEIAELVKRIRGLPQLVELYEAYGSIRLFCDSIGDDSAFFIASSSQWSALRKMLHEWFRTLSESERKSLLPEWIETSVVIGEVPMSGNYFLVPLRGEDAGSVFEFEHDGFEFIRRGKDIDEFLGYISTVNDRLIRDILTHTRYSDGESDIQWMPKKYTFDTRAL